MRVLHPDRQGSQGHLIVCLVRWALYHCARLSLLRQGYIRASQLHFSPGFHPRVSVST